MTLDLGVSLLRFLRFAFFVFSPVSLYSQAPHDLSALQRMDENLRYLVEKAPIVFTGMIVTGAQSLTNKHVDVFGSGAAPCAEYEIQVGTVLRGAELPHVTKMTYCLSGVRLGMKGRAVGAPSIGGRQVFFAERGASGAPVSFNDVLRSSYPIACSGVRKGDRFGDIASTVFDLMLGLGVDCDITLLRDANYMTHAVAASVWVLGEKQTIQKMEAAVRQQEPSAAATACIVGAEATLGLWGCLEKLQRVSQVDDGTKQRASNALADKRRSIAELRDWLNRDPRLWIQDRLTRSSRGSVRDVLELLQQVPDDTIRMKAAHLSKD